MASDKHFSNEEFHDLTAHDAAGRSPACLLCEAMLPEAVDHALSTSDQRIFDAHVASCVDCSRELAEARRGAAWLGMLKAQAPEPPAHLLAKILAQTSGAQTSGATAPAAASPVVAASTVRPPVSYEQQAPVYPAVAMALPDAAETRHRWSVSARLSGFGHQLRAMFTIEDRRSTFQPRLAMTAAMAFFSIALTLNLTGVRLHSLHAEQFTPAGLRRTVIDQAAAVTRSFQNNRSVYQFESRMAELRDDTFTPSEQGDGR
jgi:hypothetical protein